MPSWKKVITSGSDAALNSLNVTNGLTVTGSLNHFGNYNHTGSVNHSGSKILTGVFSQTGSMNISGSTTQIGTNVLLGNTTLSGSIIISGSTTTPVTPTIKIYGDMETNGVIKFAPVVKNIDTSISASYIYVSGSTNDLYFSQNGLGYNNVTRLRWIEGNLYTGLLNGGLISSQSSTMYQISSGSGIIVNLNASYNENPFPTIEYINWSNVSASIAPFSASYDQQFVAIQSNGTIYAQGEPYNDGQYNTLIPIGVVLHQNHATINGTQTFASLAYGWKQRSSDFIRAFGPLKISGMTLAVSGSSTGSLVVSNGIAWSDGRNYTVDPNNPSYITDSGTTVSKIFRYYQSGSSWVYDTNAGAGYGAIDPTQYSLNGVLTSVPGTGANREWSIQRVYWFPNSVTKAFYVYYGNASYATELDAIANINIEPFTEAPNTAAQAVYLGAIVVRNNADFTTAASYKIIPGGLFRTIGGSGGGGGSVTQTLAGLSDVSISGPSAGQPLAYDSSTAKWVNTSSITANLTGNASTATSASYAATASYVVTAQTASYVLNAVSASFASTASRVNTLNQTVIITGSAAIGTSSLGPFENTLTLGARDAASEGGQIGFNAPGGTYTSASFMDNWQNKARILKGNNTTSTGLIAQWDIHTTQMQLPGYTAASSFPGTATANLAVDSGGNVITVSTSGGTVFPYTGNAVITGSLTATTGFIAPNTNGAMYLRGGDDVELWDINISNHLGVYGQQDSTVASIKLGSGGGIISGKSNNIGIGTINPTSASLTVNGNVWANSFTGSLQGTATTASYVLNAVSSSFASTASYVVTAQTASYVLNAVSASYATQALSSSFATTASYATQALSASYAPTTPTFPYTGDAQISGSLGVTGSFGIQTYDAFMSSAFVNAIQITNTSRNIYDIFGTDSIDAGARFLKDNTSGPSLGWLSRTMFDSATAQSIDWQNRIAYDASGTTYAIDWNNRFVVDGTGISSIVWGSRELNDSTGNAVITWNHLAQAQAVEINSYTRKILPLATIVESFSNLPVYASFNPDGEILNGVALDSSVANFDLVYLNTDNKWYPVVVSTSSSSKLLGIAWGVGTGKEKVFIEGTMVVALASSGATDAPLVDGIDHGLPIYIKTGGGIFMAAGPPGSAGDYVRVLGHAYYQGTAASDYWVMKFRPSNDWYVI